MNVTTFATLAAACAPLVHLTTAQALVSAESGFNPHAIGVVGGTLDRQPRNLAEALATVRSLRSHGWDYSVGLTQINDRNFARLGLDDRSAFDPCKNLHAMQTVLGECFTRAGLDGAQTSVRKALSCYYSGNFTAGFAHGYVGRVVSAAAKGIAADRPP